MSAEAVTVSAHKRQSQERSRHAHYLSKDSSLKSLAHARSNERTYMAVRLDDLLADCASLAFGLSIRGERIGSGDDSLGRVVLSSTSAVRSENNLQRLAAAAATAAGIARNTSDAAIRRQISQWTRSLRLNSTVALDIHQAFGWEQLGLTARRPIAKGHLVHDLFFLLFPVTPQEAQLMEDNAHPILNGHMSIELGAGVKGGRRFGGTYMACGYARLMNHSCDPNIQWEVKGVTYTGEVEVRMRALRRIEAGEELVVLYGDDYFGPGNQDCKCPHQELHAPKDIIQSAITWQAQPLAPLPAITWQAQPLAPLPPFTRDDVPSSRSPSVIDMTLLVDEDDLTADTDNDDIEWLEWDGDHQVTISKRPVPVRAPNTSVNIEPTERSNLDAEEWARTVERLLQFARGEVGGTRERDSVVKCMTKPVAEPVAAEEEGWAIGRAHKRPKLGQETHVAGTEENPWILDDD